ncbi:hypothetical protein FA13DRAFT_1730458 [Coprinellus micaceus]|uniref:Uncharacterized protein n=1 Tax=Coprinellus micaceus TaxID=71717 RepID=A0A4Y7TIP9_COPMI|nr:hypothetical protein FA13DRAFT_1730458 [Coprinellus micaceus]
MQTRCKLSPRAHQRSSPVQASRAAILSSLAPATNALGYRAMLQFIDPPPITMRSLPRRHSGGR